MEDTLRRLAAERAELEATPAAGLSEEQALELEQLAAEVGEGIRRATGADRRWVYDRLQLTVRVGLDPNGVKLGKRHRFRYDAEAVIELRGTATKLTSLPGT